MSFTVTYCPNGSTCGCVPVDSNQYVAGQTITIADNDATKAPYDQTDGSDNILNIKTGNLVLDGATVLIYWNTKPDGSGDIHGWPSDTTFDMPTPGGNIILYAQWCVTTGLKKGGVTEHYAFSYDSSLQAIGIEPDRTNQLIDQCERDYDIMRKWFGATLEPFPKPESVYVTRMTGGASNTEVIRLMPNDNTVDLLRCLIVSEVTECFMLAQDKGWGYNPGLGKDNEESCGEGLSLFLTEQFQVKTGMAITSTGSGNNWLNSSLPPGTTGSTQIDSGDNGPKGHNYGPRQDYVKTTVPWPLNGPGTGCSILFLYYLHTQLGHSINDIIANAPGYHYQNNIKLLNAVSCLRGVYQNLTHDDADPFPAFKNLLGNFFPPEETSTILGPNPDNPFPLLEGFQRTVTVTPQETSNGTAKISKSGSTQLSAFPGVCPVKEYEWALTETPQKLICRATVQGFGQPVFSWSVNGEAVSEDGELFVPARLFRDDPNNPNQPTVSSGTVLLFCKQIKRASPIDGLSAELDISSVNFPGHIELTVVVSVQEKFAPADSSSGSAFGTLDTQSLTYDENYYKDRARCAAAFRTRLDNFKSWRWILIALTLPDPGPEVTAGMRLLLEVEKGIEEIRQQDAKLAHEISEVLSKVLNVPSLNLLGRNEEDERL